MIKKKDNAILIIKNIISAIMDIFFPTHVNCGLCQADLIGNTYFCKSCLEASLPHSEDTCSVCGRLLTLDKAYFEHYRGRCKICQTTFYFFKAHVAFTMYEGRAKNMLLNVKYRGELQYVPIIAEGLAHAIGNSSFSSDFDYIIPVPIHKFRKLFRGFNQSEEYALALRDFFPKVTVLKALKRPKHTKKLKNLDKDSRKKMLEDAIIIERECIGVLKGKRVLVIDDIFTTGSTLNACAKVLYENGAEVIYAATFAMGQ